MPQDIWSRRLISISTRLDWDQLRIGAAYLKQVRAVAATDATLNSLFYKHGFAIVDFKRDYLRPTWMMTKEGAINRYHKIGSLCDVTTNLITDYIRHDKR